MAEENAGPTRVSDALEQAGRDAALALVHAVAEADGTAPLSEDGRLALAHGRAGALHFVWRAEQAVAGYLYLSPADEAQDRTAELCVAPDFRRRGIGRALVEAALDETVGALRIWAHGSLTAAARLAESLGFTAVRDLRLMELPLVHRTCGMAGSVPALPSVPPPPPTPEGVALRTFRPGEDEAAWLALNARAFAHHPEQGAWTARDLAEREAEPWFDPAGFFLAESTAGGSAGELLGFHWTKVHPAGEYGADPVGEIYVLGVDPATGGRGLGRLLALVGLQHLAQSRLQIVVLYVDGDNVPAVRLYESLGFRNRTVDTLYERRGSG